MPPVSGENPPDSVPGFVCTVPKYVFVEKESIAILPPAPPPPSLEVPLPPLPPLAKMVLGEEPLNVAALIQMLPPEPPPPP